MECPQKTQVQIPTWDYNIDCSEFEINLPYSNSRRPGEICHLPALELLSRAASSVGVCTIPAGPNTGSNPGGGRILKKQKKHHKQYTLYRYTTYNIEEQSIKLKQDQLISSYFIKSMCFV